MNIIVFSKDRAMQLELFIRSFNKYVKDFDKYNIKILYTYSNNKYMEGYNKLFDMKYPNVTFVKENNFKSDLQSMIDINDKYTVFFVDDNTFKHPIDFYDKQMEIFENDKQILCRSLRLYPGLTFCYTMNVPMTKPVFLHNNIFFWRGQSADFGYPMSVDGHIFRTPEIMQYVNGIEYNNPNSFEGNMAPRPMNLPKMICYDKSIIVNNPCNKVQTNNANLHGKVKPEDLNSKFLDGYVISLENIDGIQNKACHQEIELILVKN